MKNWTIFAAVVLTALTPIVGNAQSRGAISVYGRAEKLVEPDEIYLGITLSETNDQGTKTPLFKLEQKLFAALKELGISNAQVFVENMNGYVNFQYETQDFLLSKTYQVKVNSLKMADQLAGKMESIGVNSFNYEYTSYSKTNEVIKELKAKAIQAAKVEADNLAAAAGKKVIGIIAIEESPSMGSPVLYNGDAYGASPTPGAVGNASAPGIRQLSLTYEVKVGFEMQ